MPHPSRLIAPALVALTALPLVAGYGPDFHLNLYCDAVQPIPHPVPEGFTLMQAQVMNRHGDRAPGEPWTWPKKYPAPAFHCDTPIYHGIQPENFHPKNLPDRLYRLTNLDGGEVYPGTCKMGQLTPKGSRQLVKLGRALRSIYVDSYNLLPITVGNMLEGKDTMWFTSDCHSSRCLQSLESLIDGFYPPDGNATEIPVVTDSTPGGDPLDPPGFCQNSQDFFTNTTNSPEFVNFTKVVIKPLAEQYAKELNVKYSVVMKDVVPHMLDWFGCAYCHNYSLPLGLNEVTGSMAANLRSTFWWLMFSRPQTVRVLAGNFFQRMIAEQRAGIVGGAGSKKYIQWSGHDTSLMMVIGALGLREYGEWPPYGSSLAIEMWQDKEGLQQVRVLFQDRILPLPCGKAPYYFCDFNAWESLIQSRVDIYTWQDHCPLLKNLRF